MTKRIKRFLKPTAVARLQNLSLVARLVVEGFISGLHKSPFRGCNVEFAEHRPYMPGDEIKTIDWKVFARTEKYYVRQFEEETNLKCTILLDASRSMTYAETAGGKKAKTISKFEYGCCLAASLAYLMLRQQDSVGLVLFDSHIKEFLPPRSKMNHLHVLLEHLEKASENELGEDTDISTTFHELAERIRRRGLVVIISDLLDYQESVLNSLRHFRHKKHEVIVFHVLPPSEISLPFQGLTRFRDLESNKELVANAAALRDDYRKLMDEFLAGYRRGCLESSIDYSLLDTSTPFDQGLANYLAKRGVKGLV